MSVWPLQRLRCERQVAQLPHDAVNEAASCVPTTITAFKVQPCAIAWAMNGSLQLSSLQYFICVRSHPLPMALMGRESSVRISTIRSSQFTLTPPCRTKRVICVPGWTAGWLATPRMASQNTL